VTRVRGSGLLIAAAYPPEDTNAAENPVLQACNGRTKEAFPVQAGMRAFSWMFLGYSA
jgi:hypothetical protein